MQLGRAMARKEFTIVVVRHGQATHNLESFQRKDLVLTDELVDMPRYVNELDNFQRRCM